MKETHKASFTVQAQLEKVKREVKSAREKDVLESGIPNLKLEI
jgi:hypothetical protein